MGASASARSRLPHLAKYEVEEEIGHGGMATVYRARDRRLGREVAVKIIHPHLRDSREVAARFTTEAQAVAKLRHPNIVEVFDVSEPGEEEQYLVVELLRGTTLRKLLQERGALPPEIAAALALELLAAIAHANGSGVVHRDIKPENVLLEHRAAAPGGETASTTEGDRVLVKLTDFGIAKLLDAQGVTSTGQVLGSPAHMAPEQIEGGDVDARADVFGMGVLLYECMVGHLPFEGSNPAQVLRRVLDGHYADAAVERAVVGARWSAVLDRALAHAPAERYPDAGAMREAVQNELARLGVRSPRKELEAWLDEPDAYAEAHTRVMIERLCALGAEAHKRGDAIGAARDYNRALAHAPHDPDLLRLVAGMHRAEARARLLRRGSAVIVLTVGLGTVAFAIGRVVRAPAVVSPEPSAAAAPQPSGAPPGAPLAQAPAPAAPALHPITMPTLRMPVLPPRPVERALTLQLTPSMGVTVSVDGAAPRGVSSGDRVVLDGKAHTLSFGCPVCTPSSRDVPAGDRDDTVAMRLAIKPAGLEIRGDGNKTYQLVEHPETPVRAGSNQVAMQSEFDSVTVRQIETGATVHVRLRAGGSVAAPF